MTMTCIPEMMGPSDTYPETRVVRKEQVYQRVAMMTGPFHLDYPM